MWGWKDPGDNTAKQFREAGLDFDRPGVDQPRLRKFLEIVEALQALPRHLGQHSGGMVICQGQLDSVVPLEPASMPGRVVVQWDKDDCADMGIVKVDLLGLGMMALLEDCLVLIKDHWRETIDLGAAAGERPRRFIKTLEAGRHHRDVSGVEPRATGYVAAPETEGFLRSCSGSGDSAARADCGADGTSLSGAAGGKRGGGSAAFVAGASVGANAGSAAVSGAIAEDGDDRGEFYGRRSGRKAAARYGVQTL